MLGSAAQKYKEVRATTSSPGELLVALYDGLFRFINGATLCFDNGQPARGRELLSKAHAIISELYIALDHETAPELCGQLAAIYTFCLDELRQAGREGKSQRLASVQRVLTPLREAWALAVKSGAGRGATAAE